MKIALINPCNIWFAPYIKIYTNIFDNLKIKYDIISWNKDGNENNIGLQYEKQMKDDSQLVKLFYYVKFASFVEKTIKKNKYDRLIVFTAQAAIFMHRFLEKNYKGKYIFDYRDLSIEQKKIFHNPMINVLKNSFANVVSSPGFIKCLPEDYKYYLSHNFNIDIVREALNNSTNVPFYKKELNILTIGGIRDYSSNIEVVKSLANKENVNISFVGKGPASDPIKRYALENNIKNMEVLGYYEKEDESNYIAKASFLNIFYPTIISHSTALSNRFYNALIYKKPMIVTTNSIQGDYVEKFKLGLSLENCENLYDKCIKFLETENNDEFNQRCNNLLKEFVNDYEVWYKMVYNFINNEQCRSVNDDADADDEL